MEDHSKPIEVTDNDFADKVENAQGLSVVDLWAEWCIPCKAIAPVMEELAIEYAGKVAFFKLDTDSNRGTSQKYMVRSIPTLLFFKDGKVVDTVIGAVPKESIVEVINRHM
jgi:thioredoxin 1